MIGKRPKASWVSIATLVVAATGVLLGGENYLRTIAAYQRDEERLLRPRTLVQEIVTPEGLRHVNISMTNQLDHAVRLTKVDAVSPDDLDLALATQCSSGYQCLADSLPSESRETNVLISPGDGNGVNLLFRTRGTPTTDAGALIGVRLSIREESATPRITERTVQFFVPPGAHTERRSN